MSKSKAMMSFFNKLFKKQSQNHESSLSAQATTSDFNTYQHKIYPWVKVVFNDDSQSENKIALTGENAPVKRDWLGDLVIFYVQDMDNYFKVLLEKDLPPQLTKDELHQLAVENLNRDLEFKLQETNFGAYGLIAGGNHEAGCICIPGIWDWLTQHFNDNLVVAIPAKDLVIMVPESDADTTANLKIFVHEIFRNGERLLTKDIFKFDRVTKKWSIVDTVN